MEKDRHFTLEKANLKLIGVGFAVIVLGFLLMTGAPSGYEFNPDIFSTRRITVAPLVALFGFAFVVFAIMYKSKEEK